MSERDEYQRWLKGQQKRGLMCGQEAEHFGGEGWQARADLAAEENRGLVEALEGLLNCPAIADANFNDPEWGCEESADSERQARAALKARDGQGGRDE